MRINPRSLILAAAALFAATTTLAIPLEINAVSVDGGDIGNLPGNYRGISFRANSPFSISSVGLFSDIGSTSYDIIIHSSTDGNQLGGVLASTTATVGASGLQWYDVLIDFAFSAANYYAIEWKTTNGEDIPGGGGRYFHYGNDFNLPFTTGPVTLINGFGGLTNFDNALHPRLRVEMLEMPSTPEPATLLLVGIGVIGLGFSRRHTR